MSEMRWIPVTERLPKVFKAVIVSTSGDAVTTAFMLPNKNWVDLDGEKFCVADTVVAWMPFPEPYKEDD